MSKLDTGSFKNVCRSHNWSRNVIPTALDDLDTTGFTCIRGMIDEPVLAALRSEALSQKTGAKAVCSTSDPRYRAHLCDLGDAGLSFLDGQNMTGLMTALFRLPLAAEPDASCYTFYQPGDFLAAHLDRPEHCLATAILYLDVVKAGESAKSTGLELHILNTPHGKDELPRMIIPSETGALVIGLGSQNWHERPTLQEGEYLTALTACYSMPAGAM